MSDDDDNLEYRFQNLHEFVKVARQNLDRNNWDYLIGASETETTLARNRMALDSIGFRPRVLRDVSRVDASKEVFGRKLRIPVLTAPVGSQENFERGAVARDRRLGLGRADQIVPVVPVEVLPRDRDELMQVHKAVFEEFV